MNLSLEFDWTEQGEVILDGGKLRFPAMPEQPGIYRFQLTTPDGHTVYVGETDRLRRRFNHYRNPGPTQPTNQRLNAAMLALLDAGGSVRVSTATEAHLTIDGVSSPADLSHRSCRLLLESAALVAARQAGEVVDNL